MNTRKSALFLLASCLVLAATAFGQEAATSNPSTKEITMTARKYEFDPGTITVKKGDHVRLTITATDRDHGFKLEAFQINQRLKKGEPTTVEFTADKLGVFVYQCSVVCGLGHHRMKGKLIVEE